MNNFDSTKGVTEQVEGYQCPSCTGPSEVIGAVELKGLGVGDNAKLFDIEDRGGVLYGCLNLACRNTFVVLGTL